MTLNITAVPGIYDIPEDQYHGDKHALSQSGAKLLLPPSTPAHFRYAQDHPPESTPVFDFGHAVHRLVLGAGPDIEIIQADNWKTKAAQDARKKAHTAGLVPLLPHELLEAEAMAAAVHAHPVAGALLDPATGEPERSLYWNDPDTGVPLRGRLDWLRRPPGGRVICVDLKTTVCANPTEFGKSAANFGYDLQDSHYRAGIRALGIDPDPAFLFVLVEKTPPYLVAVVDLDEQAKIIGEFRMRQAIDTYQKCTETGVWPGYSTEIELVSLPYWYTRTHEQELAPSW